MGDFKLDIEVKVIIRPVDPKVGTTQRGPWERNQSIYKDRKSAMYHNVDKSAVEALVANAIAAVEEQQALGVKPTKVVEMVGEEQVTSTSIQTKAIVDNKGVSTVLTCEYGPTPEIAEASEVATVSPDVSNDSTFPESYYNIEYSEYKQNNYKTHNTKYL